MQEVSLWTEERRLSRDGSVSPVHTQPSAPSAFLCILWLRPPLLRGLEGVQDATVALTGEAQERTYIPLPEHITQECKLTIHSPW